LQSKFLLKNPNVCLSVYVLCNKTRGGEKERKIKIKKYSQTKCLTCVVFCTQKRKTFLCNNEPKKKKNFKTRQWVLDFFLSSSRSLCDLQTH
jgi:hypothetical protein